MTSHSTARVRCCPHTCLAEFSLNLSSVCCCSTLPTTTLISITSKPAPSLSLILSPSTGLPKTPVGEPDPVLATGPIETPHLDPVLATSPIETPHPDPASPRHQPNQDRKSRPSVTGRSRPQVRPSVTGRSKTAGPTRCYWPIRTPES